jgi:hypothetical protein
LRDEVSVLGKQIAELNDRLVILDSSKDKGLWQLYSLHGDLCIVMIPKDLPGV